MLKNILKLDGAQELGKSEQQTIHGGRRSCESFDDCGSGNCCSFGICYPIGTPGHLCTIEIPPFGGC